MHCKIKKKKKIISVLIVDFACFNLSHSFPLWALPQLIAQHTPLGFKDAVTDRSANIKAW